MELCGGQVKVSLVTPPKRPGSLPGEDLGRLAGEGRPGLAQSDAIQSLPLQVVSLTRTLEAG